MAALRSFKRIPGPLQLLLMMILLPRDLVVTGQNLEVTQLPETVSVKAGHNLTLQCTLTETNLPGGVRWYKGLDRNQPPVYSDKQGASNRGKRLVAGSNTDFSLNILNIGPEDAGTYYCVKFRAGIPERELASGKGTQVIIIVAQQQSLLVLWLLLFLNKAAVLLLSCLFLTQMCRCAEAKSHSRKPQEVKGFESPIRNACS
ncbi:tyrosine-protein phosphatase non-receptor type substrate 1-like [Crotalus tigris]|uniref:tyrosine-protein phosphatase non-receptor type substrate 1-like n=1 Tax=Crotalus tigris TaxID=88082 RepID=UPI00192F2ED9|nr:tyrosine-protein phosphatase non-receptor type substrate 1-like [Crotalus tigris]